MRATPLAVALLVGAPLVACGDPAPVVTEADAARAVCTVLVDWTDDVAAIVAEAQPRLQEGADVRRPLLAALDEVIARTEALGREEAALELPDTAGGSALAAMLAAGHRAALEDLAGLRTELAAIPTPDPESATYRRSQLVVELEKPRSLVKPDAVDLEDPALEAALAEEPSCRFVVRS